MPTLTWTYTDAIAAAGDPIDYEVFDEIQSNVNLINTALGLKGTSTFNGSTGRAITITAQADATYHVSITATADTGGNVGDIWVVNDSTTQFTVYCSGTATTAFRYKVMS
jgi:hypothetical protein